MKNILQNKKNSLAILYSMAFFLALAGAIPAYIQSSYLGTFFGLSFVAFIYIIANVFSFLFIFIFPKIIKKLGNYATAIRTSCLFLLSLLILGISNNNIVTLISFVSLITSSTLIWINMDVFVESFSDDAATGRIRTLYFTIINLSWIIAPTISSYLFSWGGYSYIYITSSFLIIPFILILLFKRKNVKNNIIYKKIYLRKTFQNMFGNKNLKGAFFLSLLLNMFYSFCVIFIPVYLNKTIGIDWSDLGWMFSVMLLPFIIIEIPSGIIADKYLGEKELFYLGFSIIIVSLYLFSYITSVNLWIWVSVLFFSRVGAALVESMREAYFFKNIDESDVDLINLFRGTTPLGQLLGAILASIVLLFLPISKLFLVGAIIMCSSYYFLSIIKDTK